jgi:hypothetical protein
MIPFAWSFWKDHSSLDGVVEKTGIGSGQVGAVVIAGMGIVPST